MERTNLLLLATSAILVVVTINLLSKTSPRYVPQQPQRQVLGVKTEKNELKLSKVLTDNPYFVKDIAIANNTVVIALKPLEKGTYSFVPVKATSTVDYSITLKIEPPKAPIEVKLMQDKYTILTSEQTYKFLHAHTIPKAYRLHITAKEKINYPVVIKLIFAKNK